MTPAGEQKGRALGARLRDIHFDLVYSSPLQRARRTAELAGFPEPKLSPLLREVDYGEYEGMTTLEIRDQRPGWELFQDGCPGGETPAEIYSRARAFLAEASSAAGDGGRVLAFAHGHILRAVGVAWIGADITLAASFLLDVATLSVLRQTDRPAIASWNAP